jgi:aquaporin Z
MIFITPQADKAYVRMLIAEFLGTAALVFFGLSIVILINGEGSVLGKMIPAGFTRRAVTGFLFGSVGCLITISPVGKISGAHINPAVSIGFYLRHKMKFHAMMGYMISQMAGAAAGALPLLFWGNQGKSIQYGMTTSGSYDWTAALTGEIITTFTLIFYLYFFVGTEKLRNYTPYGIPILYCLMVAIEAPYSGCSTNPARSFGPALVSENFLQLWIFCLGPLIGVFLAAVLFGLLRLKKYYALESARVSYFNAPTHASLKSR